MKGKALPRVGIVKTKEVDKAEPLWEILSILFGWDRGKVRGERQVGEVDYILASCLWKP